MYDGRQKDTHPFLTLGDLNLQKSMLQKWRVHYIGHVSGG